MSISRKISVMILLVAMVCCWQFTIIETKAEEVSGEAVTENVTVENPTTSVTVEESTTIETPTTTVTVEEPTTKDNTKKISAKVRGYSVTKKGKVLKCLYSGKKQKNVYFAIVHKKGNYKVVSPKTKGAYIYYFDKKGNGKKYKETNIVSIKYKKKSAKYFVKAGKIGTGWYKKDGTKYYYLSGKLVTGWKKISGKTYYFSKSKKNKGKLIRNTIIDDGKKAYYVDSYGVRVTAKEVNLAVKFVQAHTEEDWSKAEKLKACYKYLWKNYPYQRFYETPSPAKMPGYANYMFSSKQGNCYRYAAALAYIAKVIGYKSGVGVGTISAIGGGMTPHGWTEIKVGDAWYVFDANMQRNYPHISSFMQTHTSYRYRHTRSDVYKLEIKNGKVTWK